MTGGNIYLLISGIILLVIAKWHELIVFKVGSVIDKFLKIMERSAPKMINYRDTIGTVTFVAIAILLISTAIFNIIFV